MHMDIPLITCIHVLINIYVSIYAVLGIGKPEKASDG